ncbi:hypothetical protein, partial [Xylella fastidiosa]|uniref:hypothetical protein n=1 Tax=Xylella fastidiosa TaxID=2371 RepID=UPI001396957D
SFNLDTRSMLRNGESAVVAKNCPAFAKKVEDVAKLTGKVWTLEENLFVCVTGHRPQPPGHDPVTGLLEFFTKDLQ